MINTLHFSQWRNCIRAQRKVNLCAPGAPKGPKVGMCVRQYEILCANDAGRASRKYPAILTKMQIFSYVSRAVLEIYDLDKYGKKVVFRSDATY